MPVLSLPLPRFGVLEHLPLRVPFPFMRIASILPQSINEPFRASLLALFKLAWSAKLQIPVLITVVFMACDIRLQLEINIIWETNNRPANRIGIERGINRHGQRQGSGGGGEDMRRAALVAAALYQQQRRRLIQDIRAQQNRQRDGTTRRRSLTSAIPPAAPLAVEEDSDLECSHDSDTSDSDTICSQRSTTSEAGMFGSDEEDTEDAEEKEPARKKKMKKRSRPSSKEPDDEDNDEDDEDTTSDEDQDDDDDDIGGGGGANGGSGSSHFGGGGRYRDDSYDHDSDDMGDDNSNDESGSYSSPLVVEVEIRHRSLFSKNNFEMNTRTLRIPLPFMRYYDNMDKSNYFSQYLSKGFPNVYKKWENGLPFVSPFKYHL